MIITVFRKKITPKNGNKPFNKYISTLINKEGVKVYCDIRFNESVDIPKTFPCIIEIDKTKANLTSKTNTVTDTEGNIKEYTRNTLWISDIISVREYVDHSLDDFE